MLVDGTGFVSHSIRCDVRVRRVRLKGIRAIEQFEMARVTVTDRCGSGGGVCERTCVCVRT